MAADVWIFSPGCFPRKRAGNTDRSGSQWRCRQHLSGSAPQQKRLPEDSTLSGLIEQVETDLRNVGSRRATILHRPQQFEIGRFQIADNWFLQSERDHEYR